MAAGDEAFLSRWSRLKRAQGSAGPAPAVALETPSGTAPERSPAAAPEPAAPRVAGEPAAGEALSLPPIESLTPESDFSVFMQAKVPEVLRRAALKKLFADPMFGGIDPNEAYSGDWTGGGELPEDILKTLHQAKRVLFDEPPPPPTRDEEPDNAGADPASAAELTEAAAATSAEPASPVAAQEGVADVKA